MSPQYPEGVSGQDPFGNRSWSLTQPPRLTDAPHKCALAMGLPSTCRHPPAGENREGTLMSTAPGDTEPPSSALPEGYTGMPRWVKAFLIVAGIVAVVVVVAVLTC